MSRTERGDSKIPLILMILFLAAAIFVLVKIVPVRINAYEFKDFIETYSRTESWTRSEEQMKKDLVEKAKFLELPVKPEDIKIDKPGSVIHIRVKFDVPVDLKVRTYVLHYDFTQDTEHY
jgi:hypothetical protein